METTLGINVTEHLVGYNHSIGMNSRATHLKFVCPRMSHAISKNPVLAGGGQEAA